MLSVIEVLKHCLTKLECIIRSVYGWILALTMLIVEYFSDHAFVVFLVIATTVMDAIWGVTVSVKEKRFTLSELMRNTIGKLAVYGCALFVFIGLDKFIDSTVSAKIVGAAIAMVELWSSSASMLIIFPDFPFLKLISKALTGEIASKLNISPEEVADALECRRLEKKL